MSIPFLGVCALSVATVLADYCLKRAGQAIQPFNGWFALGFGMYAASAFGWVYVFRHLRFAEAGVIYSLAVILLMVLTGVVCFKETLRLGEYVGIVLAILSIVLLKRFA
jgi:small multidrug resistance pump